MIRPIAAVAFAIISVCGILAQPSAFEVATIQPSTPPFKERTFRFAGPRRFTANNTTLKECVGFAYNVGPGLISGGPSWTGTDRYSIVAEISGETPLAPGQLTPMFQALLADRFKLRLHREQQERPVYNLMLGKSELKLKESAASDRPPSLLIRPSGAGADTSGAQRDYGRSCFVAAASHPGPPRI